MTIIFEKISRNVCSILINRPAKRNAVDLKTLKGLKDALQQFESEKDLHVALLGGVEGNFCAGLDLNEIVNQETGLPNISQLKLMQWPPVDPVTYDEQHLRANLSNKITIAAIEGHAAGFGYELALRCDFRVADRNARMGFMNRRFGIPIFNGGTVLLPRLIGHSRASELIATGKAQLAPEALQYGVINYISDIGCASGRSINLARCLAKFDQKSLLADLHSHRSLSSIDRSSLISEREVAFKCLEESGPLEVAAKFLSGKLCRHGNFDLGNLLKPEAEVTL